MKRRNFLSGGLIAIAGALLPIRGTVAPSSKKICMWAGDPLGKFCFAYLDGKQMQHCRMADEERGEVILSVMDWDNHYTPIMDAVTREIRVATINLQGDVEIRLKDDAPQWAKREYLKLRGG